MAGVRSQFDTVVVDSSGNALNNITVYAYQQGTTTPITIYSTKGGGGTLTNPITTGSNGLVQFWAPPGTYDIKFHDATLPARISDRTFTWDAVSGADDGIPQAKVEGLAASLAALSALVVPVGTVLPYAASAAPTGFFNCDGSAYSQTTYAALYAVIAGTYGSSGGNFNVPDLRGRVPIKADGGASRVTSNNALGQSAGVQTHTLSLGESPAHTHNISLAPYTVITSLGGGVAGGANQYGPITGFATNPSFNSDSKGGNGAHNNMQPYLVLNYIIKY
jgi:microcystin-dependent protein